MGSVEQLLRCLHRALHGRHVPGRPGSESPRRPYFNVLVEKFKPLLRANHWPHYHQKTINVIPQQGSLRGIKLPNILVFLLLSPMLPPWAGCLPCRTNQRKKTDYPAELTAYHAKSYRLPCWKIMPTLLGKPADKSHLPCWARTERLAQNLSLPLPK